MGHERIGPERAEPVGDLFHARAAIAEHKPLLATVEPCNHSGCVVDTAHVVERHVRILATTYAGRFEVRRNDFPPSIAGAREPVEQLPGIPDGGGKPEALDVQPREPRQTLCNTEQMPAPIVTGEGVKFIDHQAAQIAEELPMVCLLPMSE